MQKNIEKQLEQFVRGQIAGIHRIQMTNGTMYLVLDKPSLCDFVHKEIRTFYKENINPDGGVNMYAVGDEFAFDFVPEDSEAPVFTDRDEEEKGVWSELAEEELLNTMPDEVDTEMQLEIEQMSGK